MLRLFYFTPAFAFRQVPRGFARMNDRQKEAIFHVDGPLLILAGAGSGKTTVIVNRIANIVKYGRAYTSTEVSEEPTPQQMKLMRRYLDGDNSVLFDIEDLLAVDAARPWQILAITFTNKAANELKERLSDLLGEAGNEVWASTFHACCARILRHDGDKLGYSSHFSIYDTDDSRRLMKECQRQLDIKDSVLSHKTILNEISRAKDQMVDPAQYIKEAGKDIRLQPTRWTSTTSSATAFISSRPTRTSAPIISGASAISWWTNIRTPTTRSSG